MLNIINGTAYLQEIYVCIYNIDTYVYCKDGEYRSITDKII